MANKKRNVPNKEEPKKINAKKWISIGLSVFLIISILLSVLFVIDSFAPANPKVYDRWVLSGINGSYDGKDTPNTFYQVEIHQDYDSGEVLYSCVDLKVSSTNSEPIKEIWINISDLYESKLNIFLGKGTAGATKLLKDITLTANDIRNDEDGWFRLYNNKNGLNYNVSGFYGELKIGFSANIKLREVVVVDVKDNLFSTMRLDGCSAGQKPTADKSVTYKDKFENSDIRFITDEQEKFPFVQHEEDDHDHDHSDHNH